MAEHLRAPDDDRWYKAKAAAIYVGIHPDTLRGLAAQQRIRFEKERPGATLYFQALVAGRVASAAASSAAHVLVTVRVMRRSGQRLIRMSASPLLYVAPTIAVRDPRSKGAPAETALTRSGRSATHPCAS